MKGVREARSAEDQEKERYTQRRVNKQGITDREDMKIETESEAMTPLEKWI